jgi:hypothetical protein
MNFQESGFETRYEEFWNLTVEPRGREIDVQFSSPVVPLDIMTNIKEYNFRIMTFIDNLVRQTNDFDDIRYIHDYLEKKMDKALANLHAYSLNLTRCGRSDDVVSLRTFINEISRKKGSMDADAAESAGLTI